jgi:hypothetical protein
MPGHRLAELEKALDRKVVLFPRTLLKLLDHGIGNRERGLT